MLLMGEVEKGLADVVAGRTGDARDLLAERLARSQAKVAVKGALP